MTAPELLKAMMPTIRKIENNLEALGYVKGTEEYARMFKSDWSFHCKFVGIY